MDYKHLAESAIKGKQNAIPTYSNFFVGAAVLTSEGKVYTGCNIESSSYSLTICAERNAIFKAIPAALFTTVVKRIKTFITDTADNGAIVTDAIKFFSDKAFWRDDSMAENTDLFLPF